jgi:hypothetical protein
MPAFASIAMNLPGRRAVLRAALLGGVLALAGFVGSAQAVPIQYTLTFGTSFLNPSINTLYTMDVALGSSVYTGATVRLSFVGDDANVHGGVSPLSFSEIHQGTATVTVLNGTQVLQTATFAPGQVAVTADHPNNGFGFGFVPGGIGAGGFDASLLQAAYPAAISPTFVGDPSPDQNYDLTVAYALAHAGTSGTGFSYGADGSAVLVAALWSCYDFQGRFGQGCALPSPMHTDHGDFSITCCLQPWYATFRGGPLPLGTFEARPLAAVPEPSMPLLVSLGLLLVMIGGARGGARGGSLRREVMRIVSGATRFRSTTDAANRSG